MTTEEKTMVLFMNIYRGSERGSATQGRRVYNQQMKRLWGDIHFGIIASINCTQRIGYVFWKILRNFNENTVGLFVGLPIMIFCCLSPGTPKMTAVKLIFTIMCVCVCVCVCVFMVCWVPSHVTVTRAE